MKRFYIVAYLENGPFFEEGWGFTTYEEAASRAREIASKQSYQVFVVELVATFEKGVIETSHRINYD